jgi:hypothetical protein
MFDFFDRYRWHLDERPTGSPEEINPEVLGYIFERYVNKAAGDTEGAYYTKDDVTGYMAGMTVPARFLDLALVLPESEPWTHLQSGPEQYIPSSLRFGIEVPLPAKVEAAVDGETGILEELAFAKEQEGQAKAVEVNGRVDQVSLPSERWREVVDRREHHAWLVNELSQGTVRSVDRAVSLNLHLQSLAVDWIGSFEEPDSVLHSYKCLVGLKVLDPTCGSGAFLFAALDLLDELYEATLERAEYLLSKGRDTARGELKELVAEAARHPSRAYFVLKTIVLSNLYGVDLMEEATEIARLRLFLALVARLDSRSEFEPLPDLDMNILHGNTLVGSPRAEDVSKYFEQDLLASDRLPAIVEKAERTAELYRDFVDAQRRGLSGHNVESLKIAAGEHTNSLREQLDLLHSPYTAPNADYEDWRHTHHPFHWFVEFPEVMLAGGFDVVLGNPPYVKRTTRPYKIDRFLTGACKDIFAPCMERSASLLSTDGRLALIVPIAFQFSKDYSTARSTMANYLATRWTSTYSRNPSALFTASVGVRSTIFIGHRGGDEALYTSALRRWWEEGRPHLFDTCTYAATNVDSASNPWPRLGTNAIANLYEALVSRGTCVGDVSVQRGAHHMGFKKTALYYLPVYIDEPPAWERDGTPVPQPKVGKLSFGEERYRDVAFALLSGRLATWWWAATGDDFDVTNGILLSFPISPAAVRTAEEELIALAARLRHEQPEHPIVTLYAGREMGNYDMLRCRHITDEIDQLALEAIGLESFWPSILLADDRFTKATGERPGTERVWPFPWPPT